MKREPGSGLQKVSQYITEHTTSILEHKSIDFTTELGFHKSSLYILSNSTQFTWPYIQYFERLEASPNNIAHLDMKNSVFIEDIFVE